MVEAGILRGLRRRLVPDAPIDSETGSALGLFNRVVDDEELPAAALAWAAEIAAGPTAAFAGTKANVLDAQRLPLTEAVLAESERMVRSSLTAEHRAAVRAWMATAAQKSGAKA